MADLKPSTVEKLLLEGLKGPLDARKTRRLLASTVSQRVAATESILLNILDHIVDFEYSDGSLALVNACDNASARLEGLQDTLTPSIRGLIGLIAVNAMLLEARFRGMSVSGKDAEFIGKYYQYCSGKFESVPVGAAIQEVYSPERTFEPREGLSEEQLADLREDLRIETECWDDVDFENLKFYKSGTTSMILSGEGKSFTDKSHAHKAYVVKCVLFPWNKMSAVATATDDYAARYGRSKTPESLVVQPWASTPRWVVMPFEAGLTLGEKLQQFDKDNPTTQERVTAALATGLELLNALDLLADHAAIDGTDPERQHLDLSPSNIILTPTGGQVRLIDLGRNNLYSRQVGITEHDDAAYVAPEIKNRGWSAVADVFSVGMIMVRIVCGYAPRDGYVPDEVWNISPQLARLIEDLVETDPERRLMLIGPAQDKSLTYPPLIEFFEYSKDRVLLEPDLTANTQLRWAARLLPSSREWKAPFKRWRLSRKKRSADVPRERYLLIFSCVSALAWTYIFSRTALFSFFGLLTLQIPSLPHGVILAADIICFDQGLIGAKYYTTILGSLTVREVHGPLARATEVSMRVMSFVALPVTLVSVDWKPWLWAWAITAGALVVVVANWLMLVLAQRIYHAGLTNLLSVTPPSTKLTSRGFEQWWWTMLLYGFVLGIIALGLQVHWMRDIWAYVVGLTVISIGIHYLSKFVTAGPGVRGGLARAFCAAERMQLLVDRGLDLKEWPPSLIPKKPGIVAETVRHDAATILNV